MAVIEPEPILRNIIDDILDRQRASEGIAACVARRNDFSSPLEMRLAGIAMVPEARDLVTEQLTAYWNRQQLSDRIFNPRVEIVIGAGLHAAIYCASRVRMGFPKPIVLERSGGGGVGGAFAVSMKPVFRLNSRSRPGTVGLPNQDKALNYIPGALIQPSMISSEEYPDNADMAWLIRLALAQFADVYPETSVSEVASGGAQARLTTDEGTFSCERVIDARGMGDPKSESPNPNVLNFTQLMKRMGTMFPLRGMKQVAVVGGGDSAKCAVESLLGIAPGNSSAIGLDYVDRVDWYTGGGISKSCDEFREGQRGRYIRIGQFLDGNISNPTQRLEVFGVAGSTTPLPDGVIVNDRTYDMAVTCTGSFRKRIDQGYMYYPVRADLTAPNGTELAKRADPLPLFRIGPAADIEFSRAEERAGVAENTANLVAMFRLAQRTAGLAAMLPGIS